jgi:predicted amino acid racemase
MDRSRVKLPVPADAKARTGDDVMSNPVLEIRADLIRQNASAVRGACLKAGIDPTAVIKGYNALDGVTEALLDAGYKSFASSRIPHLKRLKDRGYPVSAMALRIPMPSEAEYVVEYADVSLNSEIETVRLLDEEARRRDKIHDVILMRDLGDLREGIIDGDIFAETAYKIEKSCDNINLLGIGANLSCYGSVIPTVKNLSELAAGAKKIESSIGRRLDVVSGGGSTSLYLVTNGTMPEGINNLRIGAANLLRSEARGISDADLPGLRDDAFLLKAEIIEIGEKPTHPIGRLGLDCFLNVKKYEDRGVRRRALLAIGAFDVCDHEKLVPLDEGVTLLGCSSDHMIADIHDSKRDYRLGDSISMLPLYQAILFTTANDLVEKRII